MTNTVTAFQKIDSWAQPFSRGHAGRSVGWSREIGRTGQGCTRVGLGLGQVFVLTMCCLPTFPSRVDARQASVVNVCIANMKQLEGAKATWALENRMGTNAVPQPGDLVGPSRYIGGIPQCPLGGEYRINAVNRPVECSIHATLAKPKPVKQTAAQSAWVLGLLCFGLAGGVFSTPFFRAPRAWQESVAVCMPLIMTAATILLGGTVPILAQTPVVYLSGWLIMGLAARALFLPRLWQRMVGWGLGLVWAFYLLMSCSAF